MQSRKSLEREHIKSWLSFNKTPDQFTIMHILDNIVLDYHRTGSRTIGGWQKWSDYDIVCEISPGWDSTILGKDFLCGGSISLDGEWESWKTTDGTVNLILVRSRDLFNRWVNATEICKEFNLTEKSVRIAMFESCRTQGEKDAGTAIHGSVGGTF